MADNQKSSRDLGLKKLRKPGTAAAAHLVQWRAIDAAEHVLYKAAESGNIGAVLQAVNAITQACQAFAKLDDAVSMRAELDALRAELAELRDGAKLRKVV